MKINCKYSEMVSVDLLKPHPRNANKHSEKQISIVSKLLDDQGWRHPIIVSKRSGFIVAGHCRWASAKKNNYKEVPVDYQNFDTDELEFKFLISDNKSGYLSDHDDSFMIDGIKDLDLVDSDFELMGLDDFDLDKVNEVNNTSTELNLDEFDNFDHQCPKCGFEWSDNGSDNS
jgi:hypothetical protein